MQVFVVILLAFLLSAANYKAYAQSKIDSMKNSLEELKRKTGSYTRDTAEIKLLYDISWELANYDPDSSKALRYAYNSLDIAERINWDKGRGLSYDIIGRVYDIKKNHTRAIEFFSKALQIFQAIKDKDDAATSFYNIGTAYQTQGNYLAALDNLFQALAINEGMGNKNDMARDYSYIGDIYAEVGDNSNALNYYFQALKIHDELNDKYWIAITLQNIAGIYNDDKNYEKSLEYYFRVLKMEGNNSYSNYETFLAIGNVYKNISGSEQGLQADTAWGKALDYYDKAIKIAETAGDDYIKGEALNGKGYLFLKKNKLQQASEILNQAIKLLQGSYEPEAIKDCYLNLSELDSSKGDMKNSLKYYKLYTIISDSLFNKKKSRQLARVEINYETDKKQKQIAILNKDNELKNLRIQQQSKDILLIILMAIVLLLIAGSLVYYRNKRIKLQALKQISEAKLASLKSLMDKHFIFSSLHSIDTFLMNNDPTAASDYLVKYAKLIRGVLEMSNQPEVSLDEEISLCKSYLDMEKIRFNNSFDYEFSVDENISLSQTQFPSMLLQPLVENAVKHGIASLMSEKDRRGFIKIDIDRNGDKLVCSVTDNGKGLQFSRNPSSPHRSYSGKGIIERVKVYNNLRKNKASFVLQDNAPGVTAILTLPFIFKKQSLTA